MKKMISVWMVLVALMLAAPAQAQLIKFGLKGGLNISKLDLDREDLKDNSTGFFIGPMAEMTIPVIGLGIDGALMYSQRGENDYKQQGLEIPVNLKYTIGLGSMLGFYLAAGPDFFFNFKDIDLAEVEAKKTQVGINLGAGLKLLRKLQVGVNYQIPLSNSYHYDYRPVDGDEGSLKTKTWQVSLAYIF